MRQPLTGPTVMWSYTAQELLEWGGPNGIGYPCGCSEREGPAVSGDLVSVTSALDNAAIGERERYLFAIAVFRAATAHPELSFCWVVRGEEARSTDAEPLLEMVTQAGLPNLRLEKVRSVRSVVESSRFGIAMPSTALLDYQHARKPVLLHAGPMRDALESAVLGTYFTNYFELEPLLQRVQSQPDAFLLHLAIPEFQPQTLHAAVFAALSRTKLSPDWCQVASKYVVQLQLLAIQEQARAVRAQVDSAADAKLADKLARVLDRLGVIQRSTVGYKARKLLNRIKGT